jgi:hypothetical protein
MHRTGWPVARMSCYFEMFSFLQKEKALEKSIEEEEEKRNKQDEKRKNREEENEIMKEEKKVRIKQIYDEEEAEGNISFKLQS